MMKCTQKLFLLLAAVLFSLNVNAASYNVSDRELNSIVCPSGERVTDIFISEKAPIKLETRADRVYFEFLAGKTEIDGYVSMEYVTDPTTVILFCDDDEYNVTLVPGNINSVSVILPQKEDKIAKVELDGLKREEQIAAIVQKVLSDNNTGFRTVSGEKASKVNNNEVYLRKVHSFGGYRIKELYIYAPVIAEVQESELLGLPFVNFPIAMTIPDGAFNG